MSSYKVIILFSLFIALASARQNVEMLSNVSFDSNLDNWAIYPDNGAEASMEIDTNNSLDGGNSVDITIEKQGNDKECWEIGFFQTITGGIEQGKKYEISFKAKSNVNTSLYHLIQQSNDPWGDISKVKFDITDEIQEFSCTFTSSVTENACTWQLGLGESGVVEIWIDDVHLSEIETTSSYDSTYILGVTVDDPWKDRTDLVEALSNLCLKPTVRIVFDEGVAATEYESAINDLKGNCFLMGEILDSYYVKNYTIKEYTDRTSEYLDKFEDDVDIWEIGNEVNGDWLGETDDVVAKIKGAYDIVAERGKKTELTLYYNKSCYYDKPQYEMFTWVNSNIPDSMRLGLDYVLVSYYEDDCEDTKLTESQWQAVFDSLHQIFPNSKLGMGECGTTKNADKEEYMNRYYKMNITTPNYIGGYFWWYFKQDCVPKTEPLWSTLNDIACLWKNEKPTAVVDNKVVNSFKVNVYPNPTSGKIVIGSYGSSMRKFEIYNILGQKIAIFDNADNINIAKYPKGLYFLRMLNNEGWQTVKIIHTK